MRFFAAILLLLPAAMAQAQKMNPAIPNAEEKHLTRRTDFETFFKGAPRMNPKRTLITGVVCGVRIEEIKEPTMPEIRYLDKLVDELAKGRPMEKILRP